MNILVFGGTGLLGQTVVKILVRSGFNTIATYRDALGKNYIKKAGATPEYFNIKDIKTIGILLKKYELSHVVNCLSTGDINSKTFPELLRVYHDIPLEIAVQGLNYGTTFLNISSDAVFDGKLGVYTETSETNPINDYGRSKLLGEISLSNVINIRCSMFGIDSIRNRGLFNWFLSAEKPTIFSGYTFSGLSTNVLANCICKIINSSEKYPNIIHISGEEIDKGDLLKALNEHANLSKRYVLQDQKKFNFSLDGSLFTKISKLHLPSINEQIKELLDERL